MKKYNKRYSSLRAMAEELSPSTYFIQWLLHIVQSDFKTHKYESLVDSSIDVYQNGFRCYLDEYPEQKELREKLGSKLVLSRMINYMLENATFTETCDTVPLITITSLQNTIAVLKDNYDQYFYNRWIKRN